MGTNFCSSCYSALKLGGFAYNQEICYDCYMKEIKSIFDQIDRSNLHPYYKREEHKEMLKHMAACFAEMNGYSHKDILDWGII